jgi:diaminopimelate epimerase
VNFEKWQALGNDYVILEARALPFELTAARIRRLCDPHFGIGSDGILLLSEPGADPAGTRCVARLRIFNPDGSESDLSGNGAREAILCLRRVGWTTEDSFQLETGAGVIRATVTSPTTSTVTMARAHLTSADYPSGADDGWGELTADGRTWAFRHVHVGNPQCSIAVRDGDELRALDLQRLGPPIENSELFPNRTNVSWYAAVSANVIRARIFERGVGETTASGTGATGAAVAHVLGGGSSPVTVRLDGGELTVAVGRDLDIKLTGWAVPVFRGTLSVELTEELHATE